MRAAWKRGPAEVILLLALAIFIAFAALALGSIIRAPFADVWIDADGCHYFVAGDGITPWLDGEGRHVGCFEKGAPE